MKRLCMFFLASSLASVPIAAQTSSKPISPEEPPIVSWPAAKSLPPPWKIKMGMDQSDVRRLMGTPDTVDHDSISGIDREWSYQGANPPTYVYFETSKENMSKFARVSKIQRNGPVPPSPQRPTDEEMLARQMRKSYAERFDKKMLDARIESTTKTSGPGDTTLEIIDALAGRVRAREISRSINFELLKKLGFKKLHYTNGFEGELRNGWTWDVH